MRRWCPSASCHSLAGVYRRRTDHGQIAIGRAGGLQLVQPDDCVRDLGLFVERRVVLDDLRAEDEDVLVHQHAERVESTGPFTVLHVGHGALCSFSSGGVCEPVAQLALEDLAADVLRQLVDEDHLLRLS